MFKNSKEKSKNYISTEEVEKMYSYQKKAFDDKIAEQQSQIQQLTNYISARFGENVANSNIATKLNNIEKNLQEIQINYKTDLEKTTKALKKQIEDESEKIATELNYSQTESYFKILQKNESDLTKIKKIVDERKNNDKDVLELSQIVKEHIKNSELYQQETQKELKETKQKIGKINYLGISSKFDKKIKEECSKIEDKIEETKIQTKTDIAKSEENMANLVGSLDERISKEIAVTSENLENTTNIVNSLNERLEKKIIGVKENIENTTQQISDLDERLSKELTGVKENIKNSTQLIGNLDEKLENEITNVDKKIDSVENTVSNLNKKLSEEVANTNLKIENTANSVTNLDEKLSKKLASSNEKIESTLNSVTSLDEKISKEIAGVNENIANTGALAASLDERLTKENETVNKNIQSVENKLSKLDKKFLEKIETINTDIQAVESKTQGLETDLTNKIALLDENSQSNQTAISKLEENMQKEIEQQKQETKETVDKFKEATKEKNAKIEEKIKQIKESIKTVQNETKTIEENWTAKLGEIQQETNSLYTKLQAETNEKIDTKSQEIIANIENYKIEATQLETKLNSEIEKAIKNSKVESKKIKEELNEQIINSHNENKTELENISSVVDIIKNTMEISIENICQEVLKLKEETKINLEKQDNNVADIELLKKDYKKYVTKMSNELAKISKDIISTQKKNLEQNRNLQVKIKAYIDNKIEKANNTEKVEELINNLNLSMQEREKLQKLEMEELLNKKIKAIQKENERILNKRIEEIASKLIRDNFTQARPKSNNVTLYEEEPVKKKKNMYELIDNNQILKRSATSKKPLSTSQEGKSQILKFFYDED